jgi:translation elongation factor EF-Tu-like GTPase
MHDEAPTVQIEARFLSASDGGRLIPLILEGEKYRPHLRPESGEMLGVVFLGDNDKSIPPTVVTRVKVRLLYAPQVSYEALSVGAKFEIVEGSRVVGSGVVVGI